MRAKPQGLKYNSRMARPSEYSEAIADQIGDLIASGGLITEICEKEGFPSYKTFRKWRREHEDFSKHIARAKEDQADYYADRLMRLNNSMNADNWQFVNAQIRNLQWLMGKLKVATYGDRVQNEHTGEGGGPIAFEVRTKSILEE